MKTRDALEIQEYPQIGPIGIQTFEMPYDSPHPMEARLEVLERTLSATRDEIVYLRARVRELERTQYLRRFFEWIRRQWW